MHPPRARRSRRRARGRPERVEVIGEGRRQNDIDVDVRRRGQRGEVDDEFAAEVDVELGKGRP